MSDSELVEEQVKDGIPNSLDLCPAYPQVDRGQKDSNGDGTPDECQCGDVDQNGMVDRRDLARIRDCAWGTDFNCNSSLADINEDGQLDATDYKLILKSMGNQAKNTTPISCPRSSSTTDQRLIVSH